MLAVKKSRNRKLAFSPASAIKCGTSIEDAAAGRTTAVGTMMASAWLASHPLSATDPPIASAESSIYISWIIRWHPVGLRPTEGIPTNLSLRGGLTGFSSFFVCVYSEKIGATSQLYTWRRAMPQVPDLIGMTRADATTALANANLVVGATTEATSATTAKGNVSGVKPAAGTLVDAGSTVD